jgi:prepilin-type N-terminal cleavage/methylation domain-containing protein
MRHLRDERGFTLAELLIATAVIGLIMAGIFVLQVGGQQAYLFGSNRVETQQNARVALDLMTRELRSAGSITTIAGCTNSVCTDLTFVDQNGQTVQYTLAGTTLNRTCTATPPTVTCDGTTTALIGGAQSLAMTSYSVYDVSSATYTKTITPAEVKVITISLQTGTEEAVATGSAGDARAIMESTVTLRSST